MASTLPAPKPATFGIQDLGPDAVLVHARQASVHVPRRRVHGAQLGRMIGRELVPAREGGARGRADAVGAEVPRVLVKVVVPLDVGDLVAPAVHRQARRPQVVGLDHVGVGVDHPVLVNSGRLHASSKLTRPFAGPRYTRAIRPLRRPVVNISHHEKSATSLRPRSIRQSVSSPRRRWWRPFIRSPGRPARVRAPATGGCCPLKPAKVNVLRDNPSGNSGIPSLEGPMTLTASRSPATSQSTVPGPVPGVGRCRVRRRPWHSVGCASAPTGHILP